MLALYYAFVTHINTRHYVTTAVSALGVNVVISDKPPRVCRRGWRIDSAKHVFRYGSVSIQSHQYEYVKMLLSVVCYT